MSTGSHGRNANRGLAAAFHLAVVSGVLLLLWGAMRLEGRSADSDWYMTAANPGRTSWVSSEVRGDLAPAWFAPVEPYISPDTQVIAANGALYLSTARGLYSFDAGSGDLRWVYPTRLPLGNAPTVVSGVAYVGGLDRHVHAVDTATGDRMWLSPQAGAGFQTNPLVLDGYVIAGNRDGTLYSYDAETGALRWRYRTDGPILFSAAALDDTIYVASSDGHVYGVSHDGALKWKSMKLPGQGFNSWWPVVFRHPAGDPAKDRIIISGSLNYRNEVVPGGPDGRTLHFAELSEVFPSRSEEDVGTLHAGPGPWPAGTVTLSTERILRYLADKPHRRSVWVLDPRTGEEREPAPLLWAWTHSGTRFPPVLGWGGALYQQMNHRGGRWIGSGTVGAWVPGVPRFAPGAGGFAADEPVVSSAGGRLIYSALCCDRLAQAYDVSDRAVRWVYYSYNLRRLVPGYDEGYDWRGRDYELGAITVAFGAGGNGVYGTHGNQNPPIPHNGRLYMHRGNSVIAFAPRAGTPRRKPVARVVDAGENIQPLGRDAIQRLLADQVQRVLDAGHLRPGYTSHGNFDHAGTTMCGDRLPDYWHTPAENLYPLLEALPHVPDSMREALRSYIKREFAAYPAYAVAHMGWAGARREAFDTPPEVAAQMALIGPSLQNGAFRARGGVDGRGVWSRNPMGLYVTWRYAREFGGAATLYERAKALLEAPPHPGVLAREPWAANAFIAGYVGWLELEKLAARPPTVATRTTLDALIDARLATFSKESPYKDLGVGEGGYCQQMSVARNFMFLVPELAAALERHVRPKVVEAVHEYETVAPFWMLAFPDKGLGENAISPLYDTHAMFQAKALILGESGPALERRLDVPGFARGDMYYILNLVRVLSSYDRRRASRLEPPATDGRAGGNPAPAGSRQRRSAP